MLIVAHFMINRTVKILPEMFDLFENQIFYRIFHNNGNNRNKNNIMRSGPGR